MIIPITIATIGPTPRSIGFLLLLLLPPLGDGVGLRVGVGVGVIGGVGGIDPEELREILGEMVAGGTALVEGVVEWEATGDGLPLELGEFAALLVASTLLVGLVVAVVVRLGDVGFVLEDGEAVELEEVVGVGTARLWVPEAEDVAVAVTITAVALAVVVVVVVGVAVAAADADADAEAEADEGTVTTTTV